MKQTKEKLGWNIWAAIVLTIATIWDLIVWVQCLSESQSIVNSNFLDEFMLAAYGYHSIVYEVIGYLFTIALIVLLFKDFKGIRVWAIYVYAGYGIFGQMLLFGDTAAMYRAAREDIWLLLMIMHIVLYVSIFALTFFKQTGKNIKGISIVAKIVAVLIPCCLLIAKSPAGFIPFFAEKMSVAIELQTIVYAVAYCFLVDWLYPSSKEKKKGGKVQYEGWAYCSLAKHIVFTLLFGVIWIMIWIYRTTKYCNEEQKTEQNATSKLLLCMFVPFYQIYWTYKQAQRIDAIAGEKGSTKSDIATLSLVFAIFLPLVSVIIMQDKINAICCLQEVKLMQQETKAEDAETKSNETENLDNLLKYKELLESGIITQEDFDKKKKELLNL